MPRKDITGMRSGKLVAVDRAEDHISPNGTRRTMWNCLCDCGNMTVVRTDGITSGRTTSCGCARIEGIRRATAEGRMGHTKYGESRERLHNIWYLIKYRCENETSPAYKNYGGRGIRMCKEWSDDESGYNAFKEWALSNGYSKELSIDRIDNDGDYEPDNCRWADCYTQANNKRINVYYEYNGESRTLPQWEKVCGIPWKNLWGRIRRNGWTIERALTQPMRKSPKRA